MEFATSTPDMIADAMVAALKDAGAFRAGRSRRRGAGRENARRFDLNISTTTITTNGGCKCVSQILIN